MNITKIYRAIMSYDELERKERHLIKIVPRKGTKDGEAAKPELRRKTMYLTDREWDLLLTKLEIDKTGVETVGDNVAIMGVYEGIWSW